MDVERCLLSKILDTRNLTPVLEHKITAEFFEDAEHREVFDFLLGFFAQYTEVPSLKAVNSEFPDWRFIEPEEPYQFYLDELRRAREYALLHTALVDTRKALQSKDTRAAMATMAETLTKVNVEVTSLKDVDINEDWEEWWQTYVNAPDGLIGIPTGFGTIDYATNGLQKGQLISLVGPPKAGKSTAALYIAKAINDFGKRPFFVSFEMNEDEQRMRYYAMLAGLDFARLQKRKLTNPEMRRFEKIMRSRESMPSFLLSTDISAGVTIAGLQAKIQQYQPDVVIVDGVYLMDSEVPNVEPMDPKALTALTRGMKRLAQTVEIPFVITHQILESRWSMRKGIRSKDIGYSSSFAQDSDVIIGVEPTDEPEYRRISIVLARNAVPRSSRVHWDWSTSSFVEEEEVASDEYDDDDTPDV